MGEPSARAAFSPSPMRIADDTTKPDTELDALRALKPVAQRGVERQAGLGAVLAMALGRSPTPLHVGRFSLQEKLGEGGMGSVYAAWDPQLERRVALKFLHSGESERERERMLAEARVLARFSHPHVVTIYDVGVAGRRVYFAMELVEAGSLKDWLIAHPRADARTLLRIFEDAAQGLAAAHARGLVHREFQAPQRTRGRRRSGAGQRLRARYRGRERTGVRAGALVDGDRARGHAGLHVPAAAAR